MTPAWQSQPLGTALAPLKIRSVVSTDQNRRFPLFPSRKGARRKIPRLGRIVNFTNESLELPS